MTVGRHYNTLGNAAFFGRGSCQAGETFLLFGRETCYLLNYLSPFWSLMRTLQLAYRVRRRRGRTGRQAQEDAPARRTPKPTPATAAWPGPGPQNLRCRTTAVKTRMSRETKVQVFSISAFPQGRPIQNDLIVQPSPIMCITDLYTVCYERS